jgi:hypothetical protein
MNLSQIICCYQAHPSTDQDVYCSNTLICNFLRLDSTDNLLIFVVHSTNVPRITSIHKQCCGSANASGAANIKRGISVPAAVNVFIYSPPSCDANLFK